MALRFYNEHQSIDTSPILWRIEIYDSGYVGDPIEFIVSRGAEINYRANGDDIFSPILASALTFDMNIQNADHEAIIADLAGAVEGQFTVLIFKDTVFHWCGVINSPEISIEDMDYPYSFNITALDGLALLKNFEYRQDGTSATKWDLRYTGIDKLTDIVIRCLQKIPHVPTHFVDINKFIVTAVNWYAVEHAASPVSDTYDPLYYTELDNRFSVTGQSSGNAKFLSCYDVLYHILLPFNARILHTDGYFLIEQLEHRAYTVDTDDNYARYYNYDGVGPTATTLTQEQEVGRLEAIKKLRGGTYSFVQPLKSARIRQQINPLQNLLSGTYFDSGTVEEVTVENVFGDGFSSYVRFSGNLEWSLDNINIGSGDVQMNARFRLKLQLGSNYATRTATYSIQNNFSYSKITWSATPGYIEIAVRMQLAAIGDTWSGSTPINFFFPNDGTFQQGDLVVSLEFIELQYATVVFPDTDYALDWALRDPYCAISYSPKKIKILGLAPGAVNPKSVVYEVIGSDNNSETAEYETILGDRIGTVLNQWGGFLFNDSGTYSYTTAWGWGDGDREYPITQLLAQRIMDYLYYPQKIYRGAVVGSTFSIQVPIDDNGAGEAYALKTGIYYTANDTMQGEWVRLVYGTPTLTYAPVEYDTGNLEAGTPNGGGSGGGSTPDGGSPVSSDAETIYTADGEIPASTTRTVTLAASDTVLDFSDSSANELLRITDTVSYMRFGNAYAGVETPGFAYVGYFGANSSIASAEDGIAKISADDGADSNIVRTQVSDGILLQSTADSIQIEGVTRLTDIIASSSLGADQNDYAGFDGANVGRLSASTAVSITGIASGLDGRILVLQNVGSNPITLVNASTSSTAANRFDIGEDYTLRSKHCAVLQYDGIDSRWRIIATDRLGRFTEAYTTTTATTASLTATSPATNVGMALVPKGSGAFMLAVPDGTSTGGDARGSNAIDLQTSRSASTQVASGTRAIVIGGRRNTASGTQTIAIGSINTASGTGGAAFGSSNTASGTNSLAMGNAATASASYAVALGGNGAAGPTASGDNSFAVGVGSTASAENSVAIGAATASEINAVALGASASLYGEVALTGSSFLLFSPKTVTGTAATELFLDALDTKRALIASGRTWQFEVTVYARASVIGNGSVVIGDMFVATYAGVIRNVGGTTTILGTVQTLMSPQSDATMSDVTFSITADDTNDALKITYTAGASSGTTTQAQVSAVAKISKF